MLTLEGGATSGPHGLVHSGHEFVICLKGQLEYEVEEQRFTLHPGDSLLFASKLQHRWRNPGKAVANVLFVLSGFAMDERPSEYHLSYGKQAQKKTQEE
jgi:quercetin dioxygenase-like cupin family protein